MSVEVPTLASLQAEGKKAEIVFWVGCAGSFDDRAKKITKAFVKILNHTHTPFAVLGTEESCSGDPAKRAGNEFLFQMQALQNITTLDAYGVSKIVTTCPHCFNTLKNEYPELGGHYEVVHHTQFLKFLIEEGTLKVAGGTYKGKRITYHDPCYLARANRVFEAPRDLIKKLDAELVEMKSCKTKGSCCGAGGVQMFKEAEPGTKEVNIARTEEAMETQAEIIAAACPFCTTMMTDGVKNKGQEEHIKIMDVAELIANANDL
jgi:Fe-S oxidoreductase